MFIINYPQIIPGSNVSLKYWVWSKWQTRFTNIKLLSFGTLKGLDLTIVIHTTRNIQ